MRDIHHKNGFTGYGYNEGAVTVTYCEGYVEVKVESANGYTVMHFDPDMARRFFRDVHQQLGDP